MQLTPTPPSGPAPLETHAPDPVLDFIMRSGTASSELGDDHRKPPVLEVAGMWSDTVVDVRHVPRGGRAVTAGSATGLRWRFLGMPIAWVPPSFAKVAWMLAPMISEASEEWTSDFFIPSQQLPEDQFELFQWDGEQFQCRFSEKWDGFADVGEDRISFEELIASGRATVDEPGIYRFPVAEGTRVVAEVGDMMLFSQMVPDSKRTQAAPAIDPIFTGISATMGAVFLMLLMVLWTSPPPVDATIAVVDERVASLVLQRPEPPKPDIADSKKADSEGAKAKKKEGTVGKRDAKQKVAKGNKVPMSKRKLDQQIAANAGVMGAFTDDAALAAMMGSSALAADMTGGVGGVMGAKGVQFGSGGLGSRGGALGGGGSADGFGGLGTKGRGSGKDGYGVGGGEFQKTKKTGALGKISGNPIVLGNLDKSLIDQVIRRHLNQIRYCYSRELTRTPDLQGKVTVKFVIDRNGQVSSAKVKTSSLGSKTVESCITGRFMRFTFPKPKGNGIVIVSYPFLFAPG